MKQSNEPSFDDARKNMMNETMIQKWLRTKHVNDQQPYKSVRTSTNDMHFQMCVHRKFKESKCSNRYFPHSTAYFEKLSMTNFNIQATSISFHIHSSHYTILRISNNFNLFIIIIITISFVKSKAKTIFCSSFSSCPFYHPFLHQLALHRLRRIQ